MASGPLVALCLATHEPDPALLERQLRSIRSQTHERWLCLVSDDASSPAALAALERLIAADDRFLVARHERRVGFYRNFERCLERVPDEAELVGFADQDDVWHPDKLETLLAAFRSPSVTLAYADMRVVDEDGRLLTASWRDDRPGGVADLASLVLVNTVTGAAALFRRDLLEDALPFPEPVGGAYHDHWLACVALAVGEIAYVPRALHDYVQHGANVVGRGGLPAGELKGGLVHALRRLAAHPRRRLRSTRAHARRYYEDDVVRVERFAQALEARLGGRLRPEEARTVQRLARLSSSPAALAWLLARSARDVRGRSPTLGLENQLAKGVLWHWQHELWRRLRG